MLRGGRASDDHTRPTLSETCGGDLEGRLEGYSCPVASRREQKEARRLERLERERAAAAAQRRKLLIGYGALAAVALVAIVGIVLLVLNSGGGGTEGGGAEASGSTGDFPSPSGPLPRQQLADLDQAAQAAGCRLQRGKPEGERHVPGPVRYRSNPPHSGDHFEVPAEDGSYTEAPPTERLVHSLEHGRIIIQHRPNVPDTVRGDLKALVDEDPYQIILVPNATGMPFEVAATAWGRVLGCPAMNPRVFDALRAFRDRYRSRGPEPVP